MEQKDLEKELQAAYKALDQAEAEIKRLIFERTQNIMILDLLTTGGFIQAGKFQEASELVKRFAG